MRKPSIVILGTRYRVISGACITFLKHVCVCAHCIASSRPQAGLSGAPPGSARADLATRLERDSVGILAARRPTAAALSAAAAVPSGPVASSSPGTGAAGPSAAAARGDGEGEGALAGRAGPVLVFGCTHLFWDPAYADVKLAQAAAAVRAVAELAAEVGAAGAVIGGDLNSLPDSEVLGYLTRGAYGPEKGFPTPTPPPPPAASAEGGTPGAAGVGAGPPGASAAPLLAAPPPPPPFLLASTHADPKDRAPTFTNYTPDFKGTLDYLLLATFPPPGGGAGGGALVSPAAWRVRARLAIPPDGHPTLGAGAPNCAHPSDHLPVGAEIEL